MIFLGLLDMQTSQRCKGANAPSGFGAKRWMSCSDALTRMMSVTRGASDIRRR